MTFDRIRQAPIKAGAHSAFIFTELSDDSLLAFLNDEKSSAHPDQERDTSYHTNTKPCAFHVRLKPATRVAAAWPVTTSSTTALGTKKPTQLAI